MTNTLINAITPEMRTLFEFIRNFYAQRGIDSLSEIESLPTLNKGEGIDFSGFYLIFDKYYSCVGFYCSEGSHPIFGGKFINSTSDEKAIFQELKDILGLKHVLDEDSSIFTYPGAVSRLWEINKMPA